ncbi:MAG: DUF4407 domain-containing protein [Saprospiraceae bacterium]|nr:DUF4407 domain-containing protein [Candidatus Brachybacter algidus]MBL0119772.1 DUF4407 domain-containing protein [Candidatus Brachybacter algidus]
MDEQKHTTTDKILWWLSSADAELLDGNRSEQRKFSLIGLSILFTWIFATAVWAYFFSTVVDNVLIVLLGGLLMGGIVLTIDRVLIAGMQGTGQNKKTGPIIFRVALALCLGAFMAQPALLYLFKKDIDVQLTFDQEVKKQQTVAEVKRSLLPQMAPLLAQRDSLADIQNALDTQTLKLRSSFLAETDGSGGTGKVGIAAIAKAKKTEYDLALQQSTLFKSSSTPLLIKINTELDTLTKIQNNKIAAFDKQAGDGFSENRGITALNRSKCGVEMEILLLLSIIMLIELAPILSKLLLNTTVYNQRLVLEEGYLLNLDREVFEKKYSEAKYADAMHQSNLESINKILIKPMSLNMI